jgi:hypothetical protein
MYDLFKRRNINAQKIYEKMLTIISYQGNANQIYNDTISFQLECYHIKIRNAGENVEKKELV